MYLCGVWLPIVGFRLCGLRSGDGGFGGDSGVAVKWYIPVGVYHINRTVIFHAFPGTSRVFQ